MTRIIATLLTMATLGIGSLAGQSERNVIRDVGAVRTICTSRGVRTQESNSVLFEVLDRFYAELEDQFRIQLQRTTGISFLYVGPQSAQTNARFGANKTIGYAETTRRCDALVDSVGEINLGPTGTFRVSIYVDLRRNPTSGEEHLSQAERDVLSLWHYDVNTEDFPEDRLQYVADAFALRLVASFRSATGTAAAPPAEVSKPSSPSPPQRKPLLQGQIAVAPAHFQYWRFDVTPNMLNVQVIGNFHASGGAGNDIEAIVAEWSECENWLNGHQAQVQYASGKVTNGTLNVSIRQAGAYCLAFSNNMALVSSKTVTGDIALYYTLR